MSFEFFPYHVQTHGGVRRDVNEAASCVGRSSPICQKWADRGPGCCASAGEAVAGREAQVRTHAGSPIEAELAVDQDLGRSPDSRVIGTGPPSQSSSLQWLRWFDPRRSQLRDSGGLAPPSLGQMGRSYKPAGCGKSIGKRKRSVDDVRWSGRGGSSRRRFWRKAGNPLLLLCIQPEEAATLDFPRDFRRKVAMKTTKSEGTSSKPAPIIPKQKRRGRSRANAVDSMRP